MRITLSISLRCFFSLRIRPAKSRAQLWILISSATSSKTKHYLLYAPLTFFGLLLPQFIHLFLSTYISSPYLYRSLIYIGISFFQDINRQYHNNCWFVSIRKNTVYHQRSVMHCVLNIYHDKTKNQDLSRAHVISTQRRQHGQQRQPKVSMPYLGLTPFLRTKTRIRRM